MVTSNAVEVLDRYQIRVEVDSLLFKPVHKGWPSVSPQQRLGKCKIGDIG